MTAVAAAAATDDAAAVFNGFDADVFNGFDAADDVFNGVDAVAQPKNKPLDDEDFGLLMDTSVSCGTSPNVSVMMLMMSHNGTEIDGEEQARAAVQPQLHLDELPPEILLKIFTYFNCADLGVVSQVCSHFRDLAYADSLWLSEARDCVASNGKDEWMQRRSLVLSARDRVRISRNWSTGRYIETKLLIQNVRYMPRLQLEGPTLWVSWGNKIWSHPRYKDGTICRTTDRVLKGHTDDVSRFVVKGGMLISGGRDRTMVGWSSQSGEFLFAKRYCHQSEISAVDVVPGGDLVVTGSRDRTVKLWALNGCTGPPALGQTVAVGDRVWSLAADPAGASLAVGTAGLGGVSSVRLFDLETGAPLAENLGRHLRKGAGMLDLAWQSDHTFLSAGYDTFTRLWDVRSGNCVRTWEEPFDEAIYCLATDNNMTLVCGTARHGLIRLWDMRQKQHVQMFYTKHPHSGQSSPVYSVGFDTSHLYAALDQCVNLLSFAGQPKNNNEGPFKNNRNSRGQSGGGGGAHSNSRNYNDRHPNNRRNHNKQQHGNNNNQHRNVT